MLLPKDVEYIISRLGEHGHRADIVGGPVRDFLRGYEPSDYDITTDATPDRVKCVFADELMVDTGIKHGTVTLVLNRVPYEITTYRVDGEYKDSRHPESVTFTTRLAEDLARRDFTMNAISYNPTYGITDPFGGKEDIEEGVIRAVRDPFERFGEDALRILRAIRFAATLGFAIEGETERAVLEKKELLLNISAERIYTEWKKLIAGRFAYGVIGKYASVIEVFIPELCRLRLPDEERFVSASPLVRMLSLFALSVSEEPSAAFADAMERLKTDKMTRVLGARALSALGRYDLSSERGIATALTELGKDVTDILTELEITVGKSEKDLRELLSRFINSGSPYRISDLAIGGDELKAEGFRGRAIGDALDSLLRRVMDGEIENERDSLIAAARNSDK